MRDGLLAVITDLYRRIITWPPPILMPLRLSSRIMKADGDSFLLIDSFRDSLTGSHTFYPPQHAFDMTRFVFQYAGRS